MSAGASVAALKAQLIALRDWVDELSLTFLDSTEYASLDAKMRGKNQPTPSPEEHEAMQGLVEAQHELLTAVRRLPLSKYMLRLPGDDRPQTPGSAVENN